MSIALFIVILIILIVSHEFGHFIVAKLFGIRVDEFGLGFPPRITGIKWGETEYTLNWIPFGGFVRIYGEDGDFVADGETDHSGSFAHKPKYVQAAVIAAGVTFNLLLAWFLISASLVSGLPAPIGAAPRGSEIRDVRLLVTSVEKSSPADVSGLMAGDALLYLATDTDALQSEPLNPASVRDFIERHGDESIAIGFVRGDESAQTVWIEPRRGIFGPEPAIGISMDVIGIASLSIPRAIVEGFRGTATLTLATMKGLSAFVAGFFSGESSFSNITGPVGLVGIVGQASRIGFVFLIGLTALISINLAVINLVPFPALDGGRLLFILIEALRGSPISARTAQLVNAAGFIFLIAFMLVITYFDIVKL